MKTTVYTKYHNNGRLWKEERRDENGNLHDDEVPACRLWHQNGQLLLEEHRQHGVLHNINGAAVQMWYENGNIWYTAHFVNGIADNKNGPAFVLWLPKNRLFDVFYYEDGKLLTKNNQKTIKNIYKYVIASLLTLYQLIQYR
jgi:antitoxin component YwqK of YwqJK toxin-antitoxin module